MPHGLAGAPVTLTAMPSATQQDDFITTEELNVSHSEKMFLEDLPLSRLIPNRSLKTSVLTGGRAPPTKRRRPLGLQQDGGRVPWKTCVPSGKTPLKLGKRCHVLSCGFRQLAGYWESPQCPEEPLQKLSFPHQAQLRAQVGPVQGTLTQTLAAALASGKPGSGVPRECWCPQAVQIGLCRHLISRVLFV